MIDFVSSPLVVLAGLVALVAVALLSWKSSRYGLYAVTALLPAYLIRLRLWNIPTTILELAILLLFVLWIVRSGIWRSLWNWSEPRVNLLPLIVRLLISLILIAATISAWISPNQLAAWGQWKAYFLEPIMILLVATYSLQTKRQMEIILAILGAHILLLFPLGLIQYLTGWSIPSEFWSASATRRITTIYGYPNGTSLFVAPIVALYLGWWSGFRSSWRVLASLVIVAGLGLIIMAHTAGALAALGICLIVILWRYPRTRLWSSVLMVTTLLAGWYYVATSNFLTQWQRITSQTLILTSSSLEIRINQWRETLALLSHHWLLGSGLAGYQIALQPYHQHTWLEIFLYPHNLLLNFWTELGLIGVVAFLGLLIYLIIGLWQAKSPSAIQQGLLLACIAIFVHGLVDVPYFRNDLSVLFFLLVALTIFSFQIKEPLPTKRS